jgi:hypothetical protein
LGVEWGVVWKGKQQQLPVSATRRRGPESRNGRPKPGFILLYTSGVRGGARGHALRARERVHLFGFGIEAGPFRIFRKFGTGKFRFLK